MALDERDVVVLDDQNFDRMLGTHSVTLSSSCACLRSVCPRGRNAMRRRSLTLRLTAPARGVLCTVVRALQETGASLGDGGHSAARGRLRGRPRQGGR